MRNDFAYYHRADVLARMGFKVTWKYGTRQAFLNLLRQNPWLAAFGVEILPYEEPPVDMATWPGDRYDYIGVGTLDGKPTYGPWCSLADGSCEFRGLDGTFFIAPPAPTS